MLLIIAGCAIVGRTCANASARIRDEQEAERLFRKEDKMKT